jgi:hypothetical protein
MATILAFPSKARAVSPKDKIRRSPSAQDPAQNLTSQITVAVAHIDREIAHLAARADHHHPKA